ncbi:TadE/TadG family type IV pilus assembly protein [Streptomyces sp. DH17]|jgi:Flp pilus assembly protein TadG|uniref:TadE/TadG family type IV pilus assembly protein n=1 Tax=Streptomyces mutabilis TaxID=67332 RepID=UPI000A25A2E9|nr:TadE/TadG family type IV pilus assembly protein [Streptomyces sp. DH17]OSC65894.1 septum determining protein [Streptomyces sp. 4F]
MRGTLRAPGPTAPENRRRTSDDAGLSTIEVVILAPVMILFILVLVAFGQLVDGRGALDGAARDAARAGSIQKDHGTAIAEAKRAAEANLADVCSGPVSVVQKSAGFEPDTLFTVEVSCEVRGLAMIGLDIPTTLSATFSSPLDPYRRTA